MAGAQHDDALTVATASSPLTALTDRESPPPPPPPLECAVCLQTCVHPVELVCHHIFCYLCVKGVAIQSKRCPMCRREIAPSYLENPTLVNPIEADKALALFSTQSREDQDEQEKEPQQHEQEQQQWFYEGRNGWWQYDPRTTQELEAAFKRGDTQCELLIAGFLYTIDFEGMFQCRRNEPNRRRSIKRDAVGIAVKGIAGLRVKASEESPEPTRRATFSRPSGVRSSSSSSSQPSRLSARAVGQNVSNSLNAVVRNEQSDDPQEDGDRVEFDPPGPSRSLRLRETSSGVQDDDDDVLTASSVGAIPPRDPAEEEATEALANLGISRRTRSRSGNLREED